MKLFGKKVPLVAVLATLALVGTALGITIWHLYQVTMISVAPYETPTIEPATYQIDALKVGETHEANFTISNPNMVPVLVNSLWKVYVDGELIAEGYSVDELQQFIWCKHISTTPADKYGLYNGTHPTPSYPAGEPYPLVVPGEGESTFTFVYHMPASFKDKDDAWVSVDDDMVFQVTWEPKVTIYAEGEYGFYDGEEEWDNVFVPKWY